jgi:hypothetical protein
MLLPKGGLPSLHVKELFREEDAWVKTIGDGDRREEDA